MSLIALIGYKQSGKNTVADIINKYYPYYDQTSFAAPIKEILSKVYDVSIDDLNNEEFRSKPHPKLNGKTFRYAMQFIGTESFRKLYENTWLDYLERYIEGKRDIIVTDLRFFNEAKLIRKLKGYIIGITRESVLPTRKGWKFWMHKELHESEKHIPEIIRQYAAYTISNNGNIEDLENNVLDITKWII